MRMQHAICSKVTTVNATGRLGRWMEGQQWARQTEKGVIYLPPYLLVLVAGGHARKRVWCFSRYSRREGTRSGRRPLFTRRPTTREAHPEPRMQLSQ